MKCPVCKKEYDGPKCPVCGFPKVEFPGDVEEGLRVMGPTIDKYRAETFLPSLEVGVTAYYWKDSNGAVVSNGSKMIPFGRGAELIGSTRWIDTEFARIPNETQLKVKLYVKTCVGQAELPVTIPNLNEAELQRLGISIDDGFVATLMLMNSSNWSKSEAIYLFG